MRLSALLTGMVFRQTGAAGGAATGKAVRDPEIQSIHYRAQDVRPGGLFVAVRGLVRDGHDFIGQALENGAVAVLGEKSVKCPSAVAVTVRDTRIALARVAARFYGQPCRALVVIGITGTNGKTTTASLIESMLKAAGRRVGVIGTLNCRFDGQVLPLAMTTPESLDLQRLMARMREAGVSHVVAEVSSHALDLHRMEDCGVDVGVFTNLSRDHLDYHGDMQSYWNCKKRLFGEYLKATPAAGAVGAVVNADDPHGRELLQVLPEEAVMTTGFSGEWDLHPTEVQIDAAGIRGKLRTPQGTLAFRSALLGRHNLENILNAAAAGLVLGLPLAAVRQGIETLDSVPGRLERVSDPAGRLIFVDYAHKPGALENALACLKALAVRRIICVFGCGGDRDRGKRAQMGEIASRYSDLTIVTSDNPRSEPPQAIIDQILEGVRRAGGVPYIAGELTADFGRRGFVALAERDQAIALAIAVSGRDDCVLIAGKGHETYQIIGERKVPFDDREQVRKALAEFAAKEAL